MRRREFIKDSAGVAGLVAGAMSMAVGEYVSVSSDAQGVDQLIQFVRNRLHLRLRGRVGDRQAKR
jgi:VIT1/CCC1 family predicted Fe2+/Mn2+ transporter